MAFSIPCPDYAAWYRMAGEFFRNCEGASLEQIDAGHKALCLAWVGIEKDPMPHEAYQATILMDMAAKKVFDAEALA